MFIELMLTQEQVHKCTSILLLKVKVLDHAQHRPISKYEVLESP